MNPFGVIALKDAIRLKEKGVVTRVVLVASPLPSRCRPAAPGSRYMPPALAGWKRIALPGINVTRGNAAESCYKVWCQCEPDEVLRPLGLSG